MAIGGSGELLGDACGEVARTRFGPIRDEERGGAVLDEVAHGELGHLAGADDEDLLALEAAEDLAREVDGNGGDGDAGGADAGLGADPFGDVEGALQQWVERGGDGADLASYAPGLLDLAEDLGLADDERIERTGDAEEVADGLALAVLVDVWLNGGGGDVQEVVEEGEHAVVGRVKLVTPLFVVRSGGVRLPLHPAR